MTGVAQRHHGRLPGHQGCICQRTLGNEGFASPVVVDSFEGLDTVVNGFETHPQQRVIVDLAAQTLAPLARWIKDPEFFDVFAGLAMLGDGKDSTDLFGTLVDTFGNRPNYIVVQNYGRGNDFALLLGWQSLSKATMALRWAGHSYSSRPAQRP